MWRGWQELNPRPLVRSQVPNPTEPQPLNYKRNVRPRQNVTTWSSSTRTPIARRWVIVVAGHQRQHVATAVQLQRVQELGATKRPRHDLCRRGAGVIVDNVVWPQQQLNLVARRAAWVAQCEGPSSPVQPSGIDNPRALSRNTPSHKVSNESRRRPVIQVVRGVPLFEVTIAQHADLVGQCKCLCWSCVTSSAVALASDSDARTSADRRCLVSISRLRTARQTAPALA